MSRSNERVVIIGGAVMGSFTGYFLRREGFTGSIQIIEQDSTYSLSSTALSATSIRTQLTYPFSIHMSLFAAQICRDPKAWFGPEADIEFRERGYLTLAAPEYAEVMYQNAKMQVANGADVVKLDQAALAEKYPWIHHDDVAYGFFGASNEGWFDAWALLQLVKRSAKSLGVQYIDGRAVGIRTNGSKVTAVDLADGTTRACDWCVNAAGAAGGRVAKWLDIDLPVEARKRTVFHFKSPIASGDFPVILDTSGFWLRPEGDGFIAGIAPDADRDPRADGDFEPDHYLLEEKLWPLLAHRIPAMESLKLQRAWAGHYEMNVFDHNGVVGPHDEFKNLIFATGFSGHGVMHSPATGRGVAELITHGQFQTIDLSELGYGRIRNNTPIVETMVY
ncbi:NAD(P)/FAD-dependent oxidoreductase [Pseudomonas agarici]|uniref:NAD(P)/FAD-dependent oxidoreductase n=1 Tax=Pseudomonas agarici TaxID=46677 RepID=UPI0021092AB6|nr:FAD-binding oxidoreductase [Pseudomonas agarici]